MATEKKQSFLGGAAVLAAGIVIVKIIGAVFMGTKFAIFNYATLSTGGHVDVDYFHVN